MASFIRGCRVSLPTSGSVTSWAAGSARRSYPRPGDCHGQSGEVPILSLPRPTPGCRCASEGTEPRAWETRVINLLNAALHPNTSISDKGSCR
jgi:hypothetical protein